MRRGVSTQRRCLVGRARLLLSRRRGEYEALSSWPSSLVIKLCLVTQFPEALLPVTTLLVARPKCAARDESRSRAWRRCVPKQSLGTREASLRARGSERVPGSPRQRGESADAVLRNRARRPVKTPRCGCSSSGVPATGCPAKESRESAEGSSCEIAWGGALKLGGASSK